MMHQGISWRVVKEEAGDRLDRFVHQAYVQDLGTSAPSKRQVRRWIDEGRVYVDRRRCRTASRAVVTGQRIEVAEPMTAAATDIATTATAPTSIFPTAAAASIPMDPVDSGAVGKVTASEGSTTGARFEVTPSCIVYEDDDLLAIDKPSGIPSQATRTDDLGHLLAAAERWLTRPGSRRPKEVWLHHRLDRGTSGLIVLAKSRAANRGLSRAFAERQVEKCYLTVVRGQPDKETWTIDVPLARIQGEAGRPMSEAVVEDTEGFTAWRPATGRGAVKEAQTLVTHRETLSHASLLEVRPLTGRMHQIRVHLAYAGHPVLGDRLYGQPEDWRLAEGVVPRPLLHAASLSLAHPVSGRPLSLTVEPPADIRDWLTRLR